MHSNHLLSHRGESLLSERCTAPPCFIMVACILNIECLYLLNTITVPFLKCWSFTAMSLAKPDRIFSHFFS